jgi:site-specific recombinase XerD
MANSKVINNFKDHLIAVRYLNGGTVKNYCYEIGIFLNYLQEQEVETSYETVNFTSYLKFRSAKSKGTTNNIIKSLKSFYNYLHEEQLVKHNVAERLETVNTGKKIPRILTGDDLYYIFEQFNSCFSETDLRNVAIIETLYSTGCRINELLTMNVGVFKNENSSVIGKNDSERLVIFNGVAKKRIEKYLSIRKIKSNYLFTNLKGEKLSSRYIDKMIIDVCKNAEIPFKVTPHTFRHTFASHLYEGGANIIQIKDLLGHATVTTTEIYTTYVGVELLRKELQLNHPRW